MPYTARRKLVPGYPDYGVDREGRVWSTRQRGRGDYFLSPVVDRYGYPVVRVYVGGRRLSRRVHILVLLAYRGPRPIGQQARHLNGVKTDSRPRNLRWGTPSENARDHVRHTRARKMRDEQRHLRLRKPQATSL